MTGENPAPATTAIAIRAAVVAGAVGLVVALGYLSRIDGRMARFDHAVAATLAGSASDAMLTLFAAITTLANNETLTVLCIGVAVLLLWWRAWALTAVWVVAVAGNGILNRSIKALMQRTRPAHDHGWIVADGWSFPSGHASGAMVAYGMLAWMLTRHLRAHRRVPIVPLAAAMILLVGLSRVVLQVHYASDVLAGFASGLAWLLVCITVAERVVPQPR